MRHHVQEKRKQRKHSLPRNDPDKKAIRPFRYLPWEQKKVVLDEGGKEVITPVGQSDPVDSDDPSSVCVMSDNKALPFDCSHGYLLTLD